jgi:creatinine amidohydrolase
MREVLWERLRRTEIEQAAKAGAVAIIPIASLEQHANHLPVNTDSNIVSTVARRAAQAMEFPVLVLPTVWTGYSPHHMAYPGSVTLKYHTFVDVLTQVAKSVHTHGFRKILLLNGHGGNTAVVAGMRTKLAEEDGVASVVGCDYWDAPGMPDAMRRLCPVDRGFVGHSGEFETSVQMHLQPELVDAHQAVWAPGAFGDPSAGSEEKGKALIEAAVEGLVRLLQSYHNGELEDRFVWRKEAPVR